MIKLYMLVVSLAELAESGTFDMALVTSSGKSIPSLGSPVIDWDKLKKLDIKCDRVIMHNDGSFTGLYNGTYIRFLPFNMGTTEMRYN